MDPRAINTASGAVGLIQFMPATARELKNIQRSIHLERLGGKLLYITNQQWGSITI